MTAIYRYFPRYLGESNGQSHLSTTQEHSTLLSEQRAETERLSVENSVLIYLNQGKLSCDLDRTVWNRGLLETSGPYPVPLRILSVP